MRAGAACNPPGIARRTQNQSSGNAKASPTTRPSRRCTHSQKKMNLNCDSVMPSWIAAYCGTRLYAAKAASHAVAVSGGIAPLTGFHSVIDSPDSVSRVMPPTTTIANTRLATKRSQSAIASGRAKGWSCRVTAISPDSSTPVRRRLSTRRSRPRCVAAAPSSAPDAAHRSAASDPVAAPSLRPFGD